jgi:hypothetical protein
VPRRPQLRHPGREPLLGVQLVDGVAGVVVVDAISVVVVVVLLLLLLVVLLLVVVLGSCLLPLALLPLLVLALDFHDALCILRRVEARTLGLGALGLELGEGGQLLLRVLKVARLHALLVWREVEVRRDQRDQLIDVRAIRRDALERGSGDGHGHGRVTLVGKYPISPHRLLKRGAAAAQRPMLARSAQEVTADAESKTREMIKAFHEVVQLSHVDDSAPEPDALQIRQLTERIAQNAGELEAVVSQLKYAALIREARACEPVVLQTADEYDALAAAHSAELARIAAEVDESVRRLEAELSR